MRFINLFCFLVLSFSISAASDVLPMKDAIGVVVSPKGLNNIGSNADSFIDALGLQLDTFKVAEYKTELDEIHSKNLASSPKIKSLISTIIKNLEKYFDGLKIRPHKLAASLEGIVAQAKLNEIEARFVFTDAASIYNKGKRYFDTELKIAVSDIRLNAEKIRGHDKNNDFLGEIGFNNLKIFSSSKQSHPLELYLPIRVWKEEKRIRVDFQNPRTNLKEIYFNLGFDNPIVFPEISIQINENVFPLKLHEVEKFIATSFVNLMPEVKEWITENADKYLLNMVEEKLNNFLKTNFNVINEMQPPGSPEDKQVLPIAWQIVLDDIDLSEKGLLLNFNGNINDPQAKKKAVRLPSQYYATKGVGFYGDSSKHDMSILFNQGFFNHFIQTSFNRGYFRRFQFGDEKIIMEKVPLIRVDESGKLKIDLVINYYVKGIQKLVAKNPIRIFLELYLEAKKMPSGKIALVSVEADMKSLEVDKKRFRWPFRKMGSKSARKKILKMKDSLEGFVLTDDIPIPEHVAGIGLTPVATEVSEHGYIVIHSKLSPMGGVQ